MTCEDDLSAIRERIYGRVHLRKFEARRLLAEVDALKGYLAAVKAERDQAMTSGHLKAQRAQEWLDSLYSQTHANVNVFARDVVVLAAQLAAAEAERDQAKKSADFQRKRADRGWFLYGRTVTELMDFKESRPVNDADWDELREELRLCEAERDQLKVSQEYEQFYTPERHGRRCAEHPNADHELVCLTCMASSEAVPTQTVKGPQA